MKYSFGNHSQNKKSVHYTVTDENGLYVCVLYDKKDGTVAVGDIRNDIKDRRGVGAAVRMQFTAWRNA